jgi:glucose/arabinose dehydrogenase
MAVVTYGIDYDGTTISDKTKSQELKTHLLLGSFYRSCGMTFVTSDIYPNWKGTYW